MDIAVKTIQSTIVKNGGHEKVYALNLDNIDIGEFSLDAKQLIEMCKNVYQISLKNCKLKSLDNLPTVDVSIIVLKQNQLTDMELDKLNLYQNIIQIDLRSNNLKTCNSFECLNKLQKLQQLDLKDNPLCTNSQYSQQIFHILSNCPQLNIIDCYRKNGTVISDEENNDENLLYQEWMDEDIEEEEESDVMSEGGLFTDPIDNCLDEEQNDLGIQIQEEGGENNINGVKKIKH